MISYDYSLHLQDMFFRLITLIFLFSLGATRGYAQPVWPSPEVEQMYQQARKLMMSGSFTQAIAAYQQLTVLAPDVVEVYRDLGRLYYLTGAFDDANKTLNSVINSSAADAQSYQIAAASMAAQQRHKKARSLLQQGLERFPNSGLLYHEMGKQYYDRREMEPALKAWLDGIEADPGFHINYYEAARMYMSTGELVWTIIYGEIFLSREIKTPRAKEIGKMILEAYEQFYFKPRDIKAPEFGKVTAAGEASNFYDAVSEVLRRLSPVVSDGITTENLVMLRTRFNIEWQRAYARRFPFALFQWHDQLIRNGHFDAYNQWLFGALEQASLYDAWTSFHKEAIPEFEKWIRQNPFSAAPREFYNEKKVKGLFSVR